MHGFEEGKVAAAAVVAVRPVAAAAVVTDFVS